MKRRDALHVPSAHILIKAFGAVKHGKEIRGTGGIPSGNITIKGIGLVKHESVHVLLVVVCVFVCLQIK